MERSRSVRWSTLLGGNLFVTEHGSIFSKVGASAKPGTIQKSKRPVALFIDDAHALKDDTLTGLKRLMEVIESDRGCLSVVLAGWPKLRNDLRRPKLEEIGMRTDTFSLDGITGSQREYIQWLLDAIPAGDHRGLWPGAPPPVQQPVVRRLRLGLPYPESQST